MNRKTQIAILALLAVGITGASWLKPPQGDAAAAPASVFNAPYGPFASWTKDHAGAERLYPTQYLTVEQFIESLANRLWKDNEAPATHTGMSL